MLCFILTRDAIVIFSVWLSVSIVLLFMDHGQRKTSCYYWSISRKFFWAIKQPFPPSWIAAKLHCLENALDEHWLRKSPAVILDVSKGTCPLYIVDSFWGSQVDDYLIKRLQEVGSHTLLWDVWTLLSPAIGTLVIPLYHCLWFYLLWFLCAGSTQVIGSLFYHSKWQDVENVDIFQCLKTKEHSKYKTKKKKLICFRIEKGKLQRNLLYIF